MLRFVPDTSVIVAARRSRSGAAFALLSQLGFRRFIAPASASLMIEYEAVLCRPAQLAASGTKVESVVLFLDALVLLVDPVDIHFIWRPQLRDPGDELVLEAAVNGRADAIVTFNTVDFLPAARQFGIDVLTPSEALRRLA